MNKRDQDPKKALVRRPPSTRYEVGYAKPPEHTRFQPGRSGNPAGRRKGSKNKLKLPALNEERLKSIVLDEAYRTISINDANRQVSIPMARAVVRSLAVNAAKGNQRAQRLFTELLASVERDNKRAHDEWVMTAIDYKVEWERELERQKALGIVAPAPLPHPDAIVIDIKTGTVRVNGPMTKEDKVVWDRLRQRKHQCDQEICHLEELLRKEPDCSYRQIVLDEIDHEKRLKVMIAKTIPD